MGVMAVGAQSIGKVQYRLGAFHLPGHHPETDAVLRYNPHIGIRGSGSQGFFGTPEVHLLATNLQSKALVHLAKVPPLLIEHHPALFEEVLGGLGFEIYPWNLMETHYL